MTRTVNPVKRNVVIFVCLGWLGACAWWMAGRPGDPQPPRLTFSHEKHFDFDIECWECHTEPELEGLSPEDVATLAWEPQMPPEETCLDCHYRERECESCHVDPSNVRPRTIADTGLGFDHGPHVARAGGDCASCHSAATTAEELPLARIPMSDCLGCHEHEEDYAQARCQHCHASMRYMPIGQVAEFEHAGDWMAQHASAAAAGGSTCAQCHTQSSCVECHSNVAPTINADLFPEQTGRTLLHRGDYATIHPFEARANPDACVRCHQPSECVDCHLESNVSGLGADPRQVHPEGWMEPGGRDSHGRAARLNIIECASCHDDGANSNCVECHRVGAAGGNPHPAGWTDRYDDETGARPMCATCHYDDL